MYAFASDLLFPGILYSGLISGTQQYCIPRGPKLHSVLPRPHLLIRLSEDRVWSPFCSALLGTRFGEHAFVFEGMFLPAVWAHSRRKTTTGEMVILLFILSVQCFHSDQGSTHSTFLPVWSLPF